MEIGNEVTIKWSLPNWMRREGKYCTFRGIVRRINPEMIWIIATEPEYVKGDLIPIHRINIEEVLVWKTGK